MSTLPLKRIHGLDILRAVAIILVLYCHGISFIYNSLPSTFANYTFFTSGHFGVDIFFVLSGFLIGNIILKQINQWIESPKHIFDFVKKRWLRTLPNYFFVLLIYYLLFGSTEYFLANNKPFWSYFQLLKMSSLQLCSRKCLI